MEPEESADLDWILPITQTKRSLENQKDIPVKRVHLTEIDTAFREVRMKIIINFILQNKLVSII